MANFQAEFTGVYGIFDGSIWFPEGVINKNSCVLVSICELSQGYNPDASNSPAAFPVNDPFKGAAVFTVHNVVPFDDGHVELTIDTGWTSSVYPLNVRMSFAVDPA